MSKGSTAKINLKDKVNDGEIDLSLCELQDVPVKEIAAIKNIYSLDLSTNHLIKLPNNFVTLTYLTKLDLSKNKLRTLPEDFGNLTKLRYLDLYKNDLEFLPLSFHKLKALRWLDLKDNPLPDSIKAITGSCLDTAECQRCATEVVKFFTEFNDSLNIELKKREDQRQQSKMAKEQAELKLKQQEKKKKKVEKKKLRENNDVAKVEASGHSKFNKGDGLKKGNQMKAKKIEKTSFLATLLWGILWIIFLLLIVFVGSTYKHNVTDKFLNNLGAIWNLAVEKSPSEVQQPLIIFGAQIREWHEHTGEIASKLVKSIGGMITDSDLSNHIEYYKNQLYKNVNYFYTKYV